MNQIESRLVSILHKDTMQVWDIPNKLKEYQPVISQHGFISRGIASTWFNLQRKNDSFDPVTIFNKLGQKLKTKLHNNMQIVIIWYLMYDDAT